MHEQHKVVITVCSFCRKHFGTVHRGRSGIMTRRSVGLVFMVSLTVGCKDATNVRDEPPVRTKLVYFGFTDHSETGHVASRLADIWGHDKVCTHWRATLNENDADYKVLFGSSGDVTILGHRGEVIYTGAGEFCIYPTGIPMEAEWIFAS